MEMCFQGKATRKNVEEGEQDHGTEDNAVGLASRRECGGLVLVPQAS